MEGLPGPRLIDVVDSLEDVSPELFGWAVALIENHRLDVHALQSGGPRGSVFTIAAMSRGGWGVSVPDAILDGVASSLTLPWIQKRLRKLAGVGDAEQYLFVKVDNDVWGWAAWQQLVDPETNCRPLRRRCLSIWTVCGSGRP